MKVVFMGLEFSINNLGCEALSYSFASMLNSIAMEKNTPLEIVTIVFADKMVPYIPGTDNAIKCIGIHYKSPSFWKEIKREFKSSDLIVDFTMGDSFSDIYGVKRFVLDALVKNMAVRSKTPYVLGPQTYGPYNKSFVRRWAKKIIKKAKAVYARDITSRKVAAELSGREVGLTTDVAFALPYEKEQLDDNNKIKVAFNPSGLLWIGGYTHDNQFGLTIDYQEYCKEICRTVSNDSRYELFLIPHVGTHSDTDGSYENDGGVCAELKKQFPNATIINDFHTPMEVKGYLAAMDVFIGARMHATIGAFSCGVATIPVSYSRKFEGLYGSLGYDYVIQATAVDTKKAIDTTLQYIENYKELQEAVVKSLDIVKEKQAEFKKSLTDILFD